jgi:hypothetical protein
VVLFDRAFDYRSMLMFCRSMVVEGLDRGDIRSGFGLSILVLCLSLMVEGFDTR